MQKIILSLLISCFFINAWGHINPEKGNSKATVDENTEVNYREDCLAANEQIDMDINNVRARLIAGGEVWWNLQDGLYIVPKPPPGSGADEVSSIFAGSVWIGGRDAAGSLKLAAVTYRSNGNSDFYAGPLDDLGVTDKSICDNWDRFFRVYGTEVEKVFNDFNQVEPGEDLPVDSIPDNVLYWPGKGNPYFFEKYGFELPDAKQGLGSFYDHDFSGTYDPAKGDIPVIEIRGCFERIEDRNDAIEYVPDEMTFWIYNDNGGPHNETQGTPIQMEVQVQAFAYATNDEINDMTFQRYKLINRASDDIRDCYFAMWVDPDLGCFTDDYIGCDVERSLAYTYNQDALDGSTGITCGGIPTYEDEIPIIGTDYFRGPLGPKLIEVVNGDTILVDPPQGSTDFDVIVELGMSSFMYFNNPGVGTNPPQTNDPTVAEEYYNYLQGLWRDGTPVTQGGNGFNIGSTDTVRYVFPSEPDKQGEWSMCDEGLATGDRRTLQASGPFLLLPGAVNELIIGAVWVPNLNYPCPDISRLQSADDLAQALFDNCFDIIDGPDAPDMCALEMDRELVLILTNDQISSNNAFEEYEENDIFAPESVPFPDRNYVFEGYKIFQLANQLVTSQEYDDVDKARLVRTVDVKNGVSEIYNWTPESLASLDDNIWTFERVADAPDDGVKHTFRITEDQFADGDRRLINHKKYYFSVLAYGYNEYAPFDPQTELGQRRPYLEGRQNIEIYELIPRPIIYDSLQANYGDGTVITRLDGVGMGGVFVEVEEGSYDAFLSEGFNGEITYKQGAGPVEIIIYNPLEVKDGVYNLKVEGEYDNSTCKLKPGATWLLTDENGNTVASDQTIDGLNEQIITEYGFSIAMGQTEDAGELASGNNGALGSSIEYEDGGAAWFFGIPDDGGGLVGGFLSAIFNFIKTGNSETDNFYDEDQAFSELDESAFYPFFLCSDEIPGQGDFPFFITPAHDRQGFVRPTNLLPKLNNVDIIFTDNKDLWSECMVVETANQFYRLNGYLPQGDASKTDMFDLRQAPSVDKNGQALTDGSTGMGYFPGYAVDVETGKRLNIFFGENSYLDDDYNEFMPDNIPAKGGDMIFNPDSIIFNQSPLIFGDITDPARCYLGGQHIIYVTREEYDGCQALADKIRNEIVTNANLGGKIDVLKAITWASIASVNGSMLSLDEGLIPSEMVVKLRVDNPYNIEEKFELGVLGCGELQGGLPEYKFEISGSEKLALDAKQVSKVLDNVNVVPNPYYGYSAYETSRFTTTVKITNLPERAEINIFTLDGKFVKSFNREARPITKVGTNPGTTTRQPLPDIEWDLKNSKGIPIASGVYLIHIAAEELGEERTIKWFGVNRKFDATGL